MEKTHSGENDVGNRYTVYDTRLVIIIFIVIIKTNMVWILKQKYIILCYISIIHYIVVGGCQNPDIFKSIRFLLFLSFG